MAVDLLGGDAASPFLRFRALGTRKESAKERHSTCDRARECALVPWRLKISTAKTTPRRSGKARNRSRPVAPHWWRLGRPAVAGRDRWSANDIRQPRRCSYEQPHNSLSRKRQGQQRSCGTEKLKARYNLVLQAIETGDPNAAERNIQFFIDSGLLDDEGQHIDRGSPGSNRYCRLPAPVYIRSRSRSRRSPGSTTSTQFDGDGQIVSLRSRFGGRFRRDELAAYFKSAHALRCPK